MNPWHDVLRDPSIRRALSQAARRFTRDGCVHTHRDEHDRLTEDPEFCDCPENALGAIEFVEWIERELIVMPHREGERREAIREGALRRWHGPAEMHAAS